MKRIISIAFSILVIHTFFNISYATDQIVEKQVDTKNQGFYYETVIEDEIDLSSASLKTPNSITTTSKSKTTYYKNSSGNVMWYVKVTGVFKYGNGSATCTSSSVTAESKNTAWTIHNKSASKSGNTATAKATGKRHFQGIVVDTINKTVTLKCSSTGQFS